VKGNLGKVFLIGLAVFLIGIIVSYIFQFAGGFAAKAVAGNNPHVAMAVIHVFSIVSASLVMPISASSSILLYYDLRIRKEGFDLEMLAQGLGLETAAADDQTRAK